MKIVKGYKKFGDGKKHVRECMYGYCEKGV